MARTPDLVTCNDPLAADLGGAVVERDVSTPPVARVVLAPSGQVAVLTRTSLSALPVADCSRSLRSPYSELAVHQLTSYGDRDGDQNVAATGQGTVGTTCTGIVSGGCRIVDFDFEGDYDATDASAFDNLTQGAARHPGRVATAVNQSFRHQGLYSDVENAFYQNRHRESTNQLSRYLERAPEPFFAQPRRLEILGERMVSYLYGDANPQARLDPLGLQTNCGTMTCNCVGGPVVVSVYGNASTGRYDCLTYGNFAPFSRPVVKCRRPCSSVCRDCSRRGWGILRHECWHLCAAAMLFVGSTAESIQTIFDNHQTNGRTCSMTCTVVPS
ncbi:MAG: hypothetical protein HY763_15715 [Planctomycetes bacterium]|nr:hypothetical protein [Planctomycetota bacterium]